MKISVLVRQAYRLRRVYQCALKKHFCMDCPVLSSKKFPPDVVPFFYIRGFLSFNYFLRSMVLRQMSSLFLQFISLFVKNHAIIARTAYSMSRCTTAALSARVAVPAGSKIPPPLPVRMPYFVNCSMLSFAQ